MRSFNQFLSVVLLSSLSLLPRSADAGNAWYATPFPVSERTAIMGAGSGHSFVEAMLMGVQGFSGILAPPEKVYDLLEKCATATVDAKAWFNGCNADGMKTVLLAEYKKNNIPQNWVPTGYPNTVDGQMAAIRSMLTCVVTHKSPTIIPLYGQADHWATIHQVYGDPNVSPKVVSRVRFYDPGGPASKAELINIDNPENDGFDYMGYEYMEGQKDINLMQLKDEYFKLFQPEPAQMFVDPAYKDQYLVICEPPLAPKMHKDNDFVFAAPVSVIGEDEVMTSDLASDLVFDALDIEGYLDDPEWKYVAAAGVADDAHMVSWTLPDGRGARYFLVPILDMHTGDTLAHVHFNAANGTVARTLLLANPSPLAYIDATMAERSARTRLRKGEVLVNAGTMLKWDPLCGNDTCRSPDRPYFEFSATGGRSGARKFVVPLF